MFPWVIIHNTKPNHVDYYHIEGFWNCSMYVRNKYGVKIHTWVETPCIYIDIPRTLSHTLLLQFNNWAAGQPDGTLRNDGFGNEACTALIKKGRTDG